MTIELKCSPREQDASQNPLDIMATYLWKTAAAHNTDEASIALTHTYAMVIPAGFIIIDREAGETITILQELRDEKGEARTVKIITRVMALGSAC